MSLGWNPLSQLTRSNSVTDSLRRRFSGIGTSFTGAPVVSSPAQSSQPLLPIRDMAATEQSGPMDLDQGPNSTAGGNAPTAGNPTGGDPIQSQRRGSTNSGTSRVASPPPLPPHPPGFQRGLAGALGTLSNAANTAANVDPQSMPLPPSPAPTPASQSAFNYPSSAQEKANLAAKYHNSSGALNAASPAPPSNTVQTVPAPNTVPGGTSYAEVEGATQPPPSYGDPGTAGAPVQQGLYQSNLASPGPGTFYVNTPSGAIPVQQAPPGVALFVMGPDGQLHPTQPAVPPGPINYPQIPNTLTPGTAASIGALPSPAPDPATAALRAQLSKGAQVSPAPVFRSSPPNARIDDDDALDYFNNDSRSPPPRSSRPASISYDGGRAGHQTSKATRQSSYPATNQGGTYPENADQDDDFRSNAAAARQFVKSSKSINSRLDEDDDFEFLKSDEGLARRQGNDRFDEEDDEEESEDDLPDHPPGHHAPPRKLKAKGPKPILFYGENDKYYEFTNFAPYPVVFRGKEYPTSEHLFQARKFLDHRPLLAEHIRKGSDRPRFAFNEARRFAPETRKDWKEKSIEIMEEIIEAKFTQHVKLKRLLLDTGERYLIENAGQYDDFWGNGADGNGRNELGLALMRLRKTLRERDANAAANRGGKGRGKR